MKNAPSTSRLSASPVAQKNVSTLKRKSNTVNGMMNVKRLKQMEHEMPELMFCVHCVRDSKNVLISNGGTVDDIYNHWITDHKTDEKPFLFYVALKVKCFHCIKTGTIIDVMNHHHEQHASKVFAITEFSDVKSCGICHTSCDENLIDHFKRKHQEIPSRVLNPIYFQDQTIDKCLAIQTKSKVNEFYRIPKQQLIKVSNEMDLICLICGYCDEWFDCDKLFHHFIDVHQPLKTKCSQCHCDFENFAELAFHQKIEYNLNSFDYNRSKHAKIMHDKFRHTKLVFDNGLVLEYYNVFERKSIGCIQFQNCIDQLLNEMIERNRLLMELYGQRTLSNNLYINYQEKQPEMQDENVLREIFRKISKQLKLDGEVIDVDSIYKAGDSNAFVVKLRDRNVKEKIIEAAEHIDIWSFEIFEKRKGIKPWNIHVGPYMTPFYTEMWYAALNYKNQLHSFKVTDDGLMVKRNRDSNEQRILSKNELVQFIKKKNDFGREK